MWSKIEICEPQAALLMIDKLDPRRVNPLTDKVDPSPTKVKIDMELPILT
jgi:hypothetical protein